MNRWYPILACIFLLTACGTTVEKQESRYKRNADTLSALMVKKPAAAAELKSKLAEFNAERDVIIKAGGEDAKTKLARLNSRVEAFAAKVDPTLAKKTKTMAKKGKKLGNKLEKPAKKAKKLGDKLNKATSQPMKKLGSKLNEGMGSKPVPKKLGAP